MLWSLSKMGLPQGLLPGPWLQETLWHFVEGTRGLRRLDAATPQDISNLLYALARLRFRPKAAWTRVMLMCMLPKLTAFNPQHLANTIWALSRLRVRPSQYWLLEFSTAVQSRLGGFSLIEARQVRDALALMTAAAVGSDSGRGEGSSHADIVYIPCQSVGGYTSRRRLTQTTSTILQDKRTSTGGDIGSDVLYFKLSGEHYCYGVLS